MLFSRGVSYTNFPRPILDGVQTIWLGLRWLVRICSATRTDIYEKEERRDTAPHSKKTLKHFNLKGPQNFWKFGGKFMGGSMVGSTDCRCS